MLLIEKLRLDPLGAVLFRELVSKTWLPIVEQDKEVNKKLLEDFLVQVCVAVEMIGEKSELAESDHAEGNVT